MEVFVVSFFYFCWVYDVELKMEEFEDKSREPY